MGHPLSELGQIVVLNGASRSGKSSIAAAIQESFDGVWMNLGMDGHITATPPAYRPGVGLRPQRPEDARADPNRVPLATLEAYVPTLYAALYESAAAHARLGLNVVMDVYHHDYYSRPLGILADCARRLIGLPTLFVGVRCPVDVIWQRREATWGQVRDTVDAGVLSAVELAQEAVGSHTYDVEVDTSRMTPDECAAAIRARLAEGPGSVFGALARA